MSGLVQPTGGVVRRLAITASVLFAAGVVLADVTPHPGCSQHDPRIFKKPLKTVVKRWDLDPWLLMGLIQTESRFDPGATSRTGAAGLGQFTGIAMKEIQRLAKMGGYARAFKGEDKLLAKLKSFDKSMAYDPELALEATALFLHHLLKHYKGHVEAALTHYNAGGRMAKHVLKHGHKGAKDKGLLTFSQAKTYAPEVLKWRAKFKSGWMPKNAKTKY